MNNPSSEPEIISNPTSSKNSPPKPHQILSSPKLPIYLLSISIFFFVLYQYHSLQTLRIVTNSCNVQDNAMAAATTKLRQAITFLPLKDLRYADATEEGHTWFMSSLNDTHDQGQVQYLRFPTEASRGRLLCLMGRDTHEGSRNSYALAWPEALPENATLAKGVTFVSYNHYDYDNIWHGLTATMPFVAWHIKSRCGPPPKRWILYHWGEVRTDMAPWVRTILEATFGGGSLEMESMDGYGDVPVCFEEAVVMRHNEGGMSREKILEVYDLIRCKSRMHCNVSSSGDKGFRIGMTMWMRVGARSFRNDTAVIEIFKNECRKVEGCQLTVVYPHNLTFCEQVNTMSLTDIMISTHGAQQTNMIFMDRDSSVMELFPKGWLELAGVGQYVYHWLANWSGMRHEGVWRDPVGDHCPFPEGDPRCMSVYKNSKIGHNETYFSEWAGNVLREVKMRKKPTNASRKNPVSGLCGCS
ncbi:hypothetical protein PHJA_000848900 [Phtheirospermum japonicum]|uniref:Glycosyltransferase 61 catalytic domain-containing protein n=1 Tax=Phtheirospermum japonicum TaxID=374723 RepID=A0A830BYD0_9LAMI|nr:hypothetical protein PHJA_000848900 [Phtheirospermum japonicum]